MVSCSGRMFAMGSGAQWLLKTCAGRQPAFRPRIRQIWDPGKKQEPRCATCCTGFRENLFETAELCSKTQQYGTPDDCIFGRISTGDHLAVLGGGERLAAAGVQDGTLVQGLAHLAGVAGARRHVPGAHGRAAQAAGLVVVDVPAGILGILSPRAYMQSNSVCGQQCWTPAG